MIGRNKVASLTKDTHHKKDLTYRHCGPLAKFIMPLAFFEGLFSIGQSYEPTLANFTCCWANIQRCKRPNIEK